MKILPFLICSISGFLTIAQNNAEINLKSTPKEVTLYLSGANINARASGTLKEGMQTVRFSNLPAQIDQNSIQVKSDANILIYSVDFKLNYLQPQDNKAYKQLEDSLKIYRAQLKRIGVQKQAWIEEITLLQQNRAIGGANTGVSVTELGKITEFVRNRMNEAGLKKLEAEEKETLIAERIKLVDQQLNSMKQASSEPTGEVSVLLSAAQNGTANFELTYYTNNCGWTPMYEIRAKEVNAPVNITAKASIVQNTGQDWKNVQLTLSTGNPSVGNTKPELFPWILYLSDPNLPKPMLKTKASRQDAPTATFAPPADALSNNRSMAESVIVDQNIPTNAVFIISTPYSIPSNGKENFVEIQKYNLKADYTYFSIPKLDRDAFLITRINGWQNSELIPGEANVYFENNYIGKSWFNTQISDDTINFALGRDNQIVIDRKLVKDFAEKNILGNLKKQTRTYEITVRNGRKTAINIELEDQVPLSSNADLSIELIESSKANYNKESGKLSWTLNLNPGESRKILLSYAVKYPKKFVVNGL